MQNGKFDVSYQGWVGGIDPDDRTLWACDQQPQNDTTRHFFVIGASTNKSASQ